jgi:hypothetical protein
MFEFIAWIAVGATYALVFRGAQFLPRCHAMQA